MISVRGGKNMKCRDCIYLRGLRCIVQGKTIHSGLGPKCRYYTESALDRKLKEEACTEFSAKRTESK